MELLPYANRARTSVALCVQFAYPPKRASSLLVSRQAKVSWRSQYLGKTPPEVLSAVGGFGFYRALRKRGAFIFFGGVYARRGRDSMQRFALIIKRSESVLAQGSECRLLLGALGETEQSAKRKAQRCFVPKGVYTVLCADSMHALR